MSADDEAGATNDANEASVAATDDRSNPASGANVRIDSPPDKNLFKGLSKRERRMLRKQMKDERRAAGRTE